MAKVKEVTVGLKYHFFWGNDQFHKKKADLSEHRVITLEEGDDPQQVIDDTFKDVYGSLINQKKEFMEKYVKGNK